MTVYKWLLITTPEVRKNISDLPTSAIRMAIFRAVREMLEIENPLRASDVLKVKSSKNVWRKRQGDYRIFFTLDSTAITQNKHRYKGAFHLLIVRKRDESTYD